MPPLPQPDPDALAHSERLAAYIRSKINDNGGWISFAHYMELALYTPGQGYYSAGATKFGIAGDFVTAPELSTLFPQTVARQFTQLLPLTDGNILELGAGSGKLALGLLQELAHLNMLPKTYLILEPSAELRERQYKLIHMYAAELAPRVHWIDSLPVQFNGVIMANEVLDAVPVHIVVWKDGEIFERGVSVVNSKFVWRERLLKTGELYDLALQLNPGFNYISEISLNTRNLAKTLAQILNKGVALFIDYGFSASEYYHPQRNEGTLMCHYRHHAHDDPFLFPGLQDITAHVDFTAVAENAVAEGCAMLGYTSQAQFLINCGITEILQRVDPNDLNNYLPLASQAQKLLNPSEMGELFKVMAVGKKINRSLIGFATGDKTQLL